MGVLPASRLSVPQPPNPPPSPLPPPSPPSPPPSPFPLAPLYPFLYPSALALAGLVAAVATAFAIYAFARYLLTTCTACKWAAPADVAISESFARAQHGRARGVRAKVAGGRGAVAHSVVEESSTRTTPAPSRVPLERSDHNGVSSRNRRANGQHAIVGSGGDLSGDSAVVLRPACSAQCMWVPASPGSTFQSAGSPDKPYKLLDGGMDVLAASPNRPYVTREPILARNPTRSPTRSPRAVSHLRRYEPIEDFAYIDALSSSSLH